MAARRNLILGTFVVAGLASNSSADVQSVYEKTCSACHGFGIAGAPIPGKLSDWETRLEKPLDTIYRNAIDGFTGDLGTMPPKGGFGDLSDDQIRDLVDYMISEQH